MTLSSSLWQSIAALDRIAPDHHHPDLDHKDHRDHWRSEKIPYADPTFSDHRYASHDDEKFIRLSTSTTTSSRPYLRRSRSQPSLRSSQFLHEKDFARMPPIESEHEPKLTLRYVAGVALALVPALFSLFIPAIGIVIIGLAADNIAYSTQSVTVVKTIFSKYHPSADMTDHWWTKMSITPTDYDVHTFIGLVVAGAIAALCGSVAIVVSIVSWSSGGRIELGQKKITSKRTFAIARLIVETIAFITTLVVLICVRSLYYDTSYDLYDHDGSIYELRPENLIPALPPPDPETVYTRELVDDVLRRYFTPTGARYNPLNWNCRMHGRVDDDFSMGDRYWQLCQEGNAARWMLVVLLLLQGIVLAKHALDLRKERRGAGIPWASQRLGSEERISRSEESE